MTLPEINILDLVRTDNVNVITEKLKQLKTQNQLSKLANQVDVMGNSFLHLAVLHHNVDTVKQFKEVIGDDLFIKN